MKKHVAGFALFCFIVAGAAFVAEIAGFFISYRVATSESCPLIKPEIEGIETTKGASDKNSPIVTQAVFNLSKKQINLEMIFRDDAPLGENNFVTLNYFRNSADGTRFLHSETVKLIYESFYLKEKNRTAAVTASYEWLDNLDSYDNLYVTAEFSEKFTSAQKFTSDRYSSSSSKSENSISPDVTPKFDAKAAKEITTFWANLSESEKFVDR